MYNGSHRHQWHTSKENDLHVFSVGNRWPGPSSIPSASLTLRTFLLSLMELLQEHLTLFPSSVSFCVFSDLVSLWSLHNMAVCTGVGKVTSIEITFCSCSVYSLFPSHVLPGCSLSELASYTSSPLPPYFRALFKLCHRLSLFDPPLIHFLSSIFCVPFYYLQSHNFQNCISLYLTKPTSLSKLCLLLLHFTKFRSMKSILISVFLTHSVL